MTAKSVIKKTFVAFMEMGVMTATGEEQESATIGD